MGRDLFVILILFYRPTTTQYAANAPVRSFRSKELFCYKREAYCQMIILFSKGNNTLLCGWKIEPDNYVIVLVLPRPAFLHDLLDSEANASELQGILKELYASCQ